MRAEKRNDKMARNSKGMGGGTVVLLVVIVVIAVLYSGGKLSFSSPVQTGVNGNSNVNSAGVCPSIAQNFLVSVAYPDYTKSPVQLTLVASQTINSYAQAPTVSTTVTSTATSSSSAAAVLTNLNCNTPYLLTSGDNSGYFLNSTVVNIGTSVNFPVTLVAPKYSAVTITGANSVQTTPQANAIIIGSTTASKTVTAYLVVQAGQYTASQGQMALSFSYNSAAIQSVTISGLAPTSAPVPSMTFLTTNAYDAQLIGAVGSQNTQVNYLLPSLNNYQYSTGSGSSIGSYEIPVVIQTTSSYAVNELINVQVTPGTSFFNTATGTVQNGVFKNPQTNANLFSPVQNLAFVVLRDRKSVV